MKNIRVKILVPISIAAIFILGGIFSYQPVAAETTLKKSIAIQNQINRASANSQKKVDRISDEADRLLHEYRYTLRKTEGLRVYNDHLEKIVSAQEEEISSINDQIDRVEVTNREIVPLMLRMLDALKKFVSLDVPFLQDERQNRINSLARMVNRADVTTSDKFRRIMEAYQIETEYGRTIEAYKGQLSNGDSNKTVEYLRIGRLALFYLTLDARESGIWDLATREWITLPDKYRLSIREGIRIARKQSAPDLLVLPVSAPEVLQ